MPDLPSLGPPEQPGRPLGQLDIDPRLQQVVDDIRKKRDAELAVTTINADPERVARANALSRQNGVPAPIVEGDLDGFERRKRADRFISLMGENNGLAGWASDRRNAASVADDTDSLGALGQAWRQVSNIGSSLKAGYLSSTAGLYEVAGGLIGGLADRIASGYEDPNGISNKLGLGGIDRAISAPIARGLRGLESGSISAARGLQSQADRARPQTSSVIESGLYSGFESVPTSLGAIAVGLLTKNPEAAALVMGTTVGGNEYRRALDAGLNPNKALRYALGQGSVEYLTEKIPASRLLGDLAAKSPLAKTFMHQLTAEIPGEQVATIIQDMNEWANLHPEQSFMDYLKARPSAALQTALATIMGTGGVVTVTTATEKTIGAGVKVADHIAQSQQAKRQGKALDELAAASEQSKLKKRDPAAYADLIKTMGAEAGTSHVYVDGEAARAFMQSEEYDGTLEPWRPEIDDAVQAGGDVAIPIGDALTEIAGTKAWNALRPDMRLSPGGMSPREAEAFDPAEAMQRLSEAVPATASDPRVKLFESVSSKLMDAGFTPTVARTQAELLTNRYATRAERMGVELKGNEFDSVNVAQPENAPTEEARALNQGAADDLSNIMLDAEEKGVRLDVSDTPTRAILHMIDATPAGRGQGLGTEFMQRLTKWADQHGKRLVLSPEQLPGATSRGRLVKFYKRFGFVENKGRTKDFSISEAMIREPSRSLFQNGDQPTDRKGLTPISPEMLRRILKGGAAIDEKTGRVLEQSAYHGSPHIFDRFSLEHIGSGEGAQAYGWGLYFAGKKGVAEYYREALAGQPVVTFDGSDIPADLNTVTPELRQWLNEQYAKLNVDLSGGEGVSAEDMKNAGPQIGPLALRHVLQKAKLDASFGDDVKAGLLDQAEIFRGLAGRMDKSKFRRLATENLLRARVSEAVAEHGGIAVNKKGRLYKVEIPEDDEYLLWDEPLSQQPQKVQDALKAIGIETPPLPKPPSDPVIASIIKDALKHARVDSADIEITINNDSMLYNKGMLHAERAGVDTEDLNVGEYVVNQAKSYVHALMRRELVRGQEVYRELTGKLALDNADERRADAAASITLHEAGIAGIKYLDGGSRSAGDGSYNYVVFDDSRVSIQAYEQSVFADGPRGRIVFPDGAFTGSARIELFKSRNLSTFLHESGHLFLEELKFDATQTLGTDGNDSARRLFADWEAVKAWFKTNGHEIGEDGDIPTEAHELWARGFERYLMEGKSPNQSLRRAFETFKSWLVNIYRSALRLDAPITDEIRGVMGRLIATDAEIADAAEQQHIELIFKSAAEAGMSESAFRALQDSANRARAEANDELLQRVMAPIRARVTQEYKDREAPVRAEVTEGVDNRPAFRALKLLKDMPMDSEWLADHGGTEGLPPQVPPVHKRGGANPADIAERAGFKSPEEMIDALRAVEAERQALRANDDKRSVRQSIIDRETEAIMLHRYGDPFTDGSIEEEALALIHNDAHGEVMAAELRALGRQTGKKATTYRLARNWARERVRSGLVNETTSRAAIQRYQRSAAKAGKAAMDAMIAGDRDEAFRQKQAQMIQNALVSEAKSALDEVEAAVSRLEKLAKRTTLKSTDQEYLERAQALLEAVEFRERSQASLNRQGGFEAWAKEQEAQGIDVVVPGSFEASLGTTHWSRLTVEKLLGLDAATRQIMHLGRMKQKLLDAKEQRDFDEIVAEATDGMAGMPTKPPSDLMEPGWWDSVKSRVAAWDVALLKAEQVFDWLDQNKTDGVFNRIVFQPVANAQAREGDMMVEYGGKLRDAFAKVDAKMLARWSETFSDPRLVNRETGNPYQMKREQLVAMALNMGNEGNIQRLSDGYGWSEGAIRDVLNAELTAEEWQFVQDVWDTIDGLWPEIAAMERRINGVAPEKVEAVPVETPHGVFRGGYYPAIYDASKDYDVERQAEKASDLFETRYTRATTRASATKEREDRVKRPILLQLGVINRHIGEVIHDITHREAVMQAHKFLNDKRIRRAIDDTLGPEYRKMFQPWLKYIANQWAQERAGADGIGHFMQKLRANTTVVGMGWRITTILQQIAGYSNSFEMVGAKWVSEAIARTAAHPVESFNFVAERSGEVRHRMDTLDRDIRLTIREMAGKGSPLTAAKRFAFHGIGYADRIVSVPTWLGAYNKAIASGAAEEIAIKAGDKAVRLSQGAAGAKDLAAVATGQGKYGELLKLMTMFYSYMSAVYSRQRNLGRDIRNAGVKDVPKLLARAWWLLIVPPNLAALLSGNGPRDDEDWALWVLENSILQFVGAIPILRDAARPVLAKITGHYAFDYALSPVQKAIQTAINTSKDVINIAEGEETTRATRNALETVGYFTGLVPGQVAAATQFLVDVGEGDQHPRDFWDWYEGLTTGKVKD